MKRSVLALLIALVLLAGCGAPAQRADTPAPSAEPEAAPTPEITPVPTPEPMPEPDYTEIARQMISAGQYDDAAELLATLPESEENAVLSVRAALGDPQVDDMVLFGHYEQDNDMENGPEEVEWIVLAREGDRALLLSRCALDSLPYHDVHYGPTTWKDCAMRAWLNGEFLDTAFDSAEQTLLAETTLSNPDNPVYNTPGGEDTVDRVFLLSYDEALSYVVRTRKANAPLTDYAVARGASHGADRNGWWWLRTPGVKPYNACHISNEGILSPYGYVGSRPAWSVRPAVWLQLGV